MSRGFRTVKTLINARDALRQCSAKPENRVQAVIAGTRL
jgi:hypothetical protein